MWSSNGCQLDRAIQGGAGVLMASARAPTQGAGQGGVGGENPYSMMCRASTSETSSLSGSGIFFFSSTGRVGGCAGCGCSSSSSCQETGPCLPGSPQARARGARGRRPETRDGSTTRRLLPARPKTSHAL